MSLETATPARLRIAERWQGIARWTMFGAMALILLAGILGKVWVALLAVAFAMPAAWIFNLQCSECYWPVYRQFGSAKAERQRDQFLAPLYSKILWCRPSACTKCGADFKADMPLEKQ